MASYGSLSSESLAFLGSSSIYFYRYNIHMRTAEVGVNKFN